MRIMVCFNAQFLQILPLVMVFIVHVMVLAVCEFAFPLHFLLLKHFLSVYQARDAPCEAKIADFHRSKVIADQDVAWLQVSMEDCR